MQQIRNIYILCLKDLQQPIGKKMMNYSNDKVRLIQIVTEIYLRFFYTNSHSRGARSGELEYV
jgi:hypothetical protein